MRLLKSKQTIFMVLVSIAICGCLALALIPFLVPEPESLEITPYRVDEEQSAFEDVGEITGYSVTLPPYTPPPPTLDLERNESPTLFVPIGSWNLVRGNGMLWQGEKLVMENTDNPESWPALVTRSSFSHSDTATLMYLACTEYDGQLQTQFILSDDTDTRLLLYADANHFYPVDGFNIPMEERPGSHQRVAVRYTTEGNPSISDDNKPVHHLFFQEVVISEWERRWVHPADPGYRNELLDVLLGSGDHIHFELDGLPVLFYTDGLKTGLEPVLEFCQPQHPLVSGKTETAPTTILPTFIPYAGLHPIATPSPVASPTSTPLSSPTVSPSFVPTNTPVPTAALTPTSTPTPMPTPAPTLTATATPVPTPIPFPKGKYWGSTCIPLPTAEFRCVVPYPSPTPKYQPPKYQVHQALSECAETAERLRTLNEAAGYKKWDIPSVYAYLELEGNSQAVLEWLLSRGLRLTEDINPDWREAINKMVDAIYVRDTDGVGSDSISVILPAFLLPELSQLDGIGFVNVGYIFSYSGGICE